MVNNEDNENNDRCRFQKRRFVKRNFLKTFLNFSNSLVSNRRSMSTDSTSSNPENKITRTDYIISVKTSDKFGAGTDANVFVEITGEHGRSVEPINLKNSNCTNKFERDQVDQFTFCDEISLGKLKSIKIWHDDTGIGSAWHLEFVEISDTTSGLKYRFPCHRWLSSTEDDGETRRELKCLEVTSGPKYTVQVASGVPKKVSDTSPPNIEQLLARCTQDNIVPLRVAEVQSGRPSPIATVYGQFHKLTVNASPDAARKSSIPTVSFNSSPYGRYSNPAFSLYKEQRRLSSSASSLNKIK